MDRLIRATLLFLALSVSGAVAQQCGTISTCPSASTPFSGNELFLLVQGGVTKHTTIGQILATGGLVGGSSPITGVCTSGFVLYNNNGVLACQNSTGGGNVSNSGTPTIGQIGVWVTATTIQGITILPTSAVPAFTGDMTNSAGALATTVTKTNGTSFSTLATTTPGAGVATALGIAPGTTGSFPTQNGAITTNDCLKWGPGIQDAGAACGSGGSGITALTGDVSASGTGSVTATLATVNSNVGSFGTASSVGGYTVNAKGLITAASNTSIAISLSQVTSGLGTGVSTALGIAPGTTGAFTTQDGVVVTGNCLKWGPGVQDAGVTCGSGAGGISFPQTVAGTTNSGGIPYFSSGTVLTSSAALTANALVVGGGAGAAPTALGSLGTTTTVLHGNASGAPSFSAVNLATDVSGVVPVPVNAQTGTTYTVLSTDNGKLVTHSNAASIAVTLPQATGSFAAGFVYAEQNKGAGTVTITPTTSTINGASTLVLPTNQGVTIVSDGANWQIANSGISAALANVSGLGTGVATAAGNALSAASGLTTTIASGTAALGTSAISSGACATVVTVTATNVATTDIITDGFNGDPTAVTGYAPATTGMLTVIEYPTSGNANFKVCNNTSASITPGAITLNWRVTR